MDKYTAVWDEKGVHNDEGSRMETRPDAPYGPGNKGLQRKGQLVEDLGSGFVKKSAVGKVGRKKPLKGGYSLNLCDLTSTEDEPDELDILSQSSTAEVPNKRDLLLGPDGNVHKEHPNFPSSKSDALKKIKFKKTKAPQDGAPILPRSDSSSSVLPVLRENANIQKTTQKLTTNSQHITNSSSTTRPRSPSPRLLRKPPSSPKPRHLPTRNTKPSQEIVTTENTRPKPRPIGKPHVAPAQPQPSPFPDLGTPPLQRRRNTVSTTGGVTRPANVTLTPAPFPMGSPVPRPRGPANFPTLPALESQKPKQKTKSVPPQPSIKKSTLVEPAKKAKPKNPGKPNDYPLMSPLSSQTKPADNTRRSSKGSKKHSKRIISDEESEAEDDSPLKPQPFPMNTQVLSSINLPYAPPVAGPSRPGKRSSSDGNNSGSGRENKKTREDDDTIILPSRNYEYEEDDTICMSPTRDPKTLCPYCDAPMPRSPTPQLIRLLASTALKSKPQPRPGNPMGRKAPFTTFIAICQRHRFETKILPEAEAKGWPKSIEWTKLGRRVSRMKQDLQKLIQDPVFEPGGDEDDTSSDEEYRGSKAKCIFWKDIINEVKQKGSRAVAGVQGQFASFEKTQPGYYGERGSVIIHQTLYDLFPPASIDPSYVAPLTPSEFLQRILVPEVGVRLIMEDKGLVGSSGVRAAVHILRDSASYGVAMFPEDGGEWGKNQGDGGSDGDDEELGVADLIVMERARKRRKELEKEDEREEEEMRLWERDEKDRSVKQKEKAKKRKRKEVVIPSDHPGPPPSTSRPKPRPLGKGSSGISALADEIDELGSSQIKTTTDEATGDESEGHFQSRSKRPTRLSPSSNDFRMKNNEQPPTRRVTRSVSRSASVDVDLCSSSENPSHSEISPKLKPPKPNDKKHNHPIRKGSARDMTFGKSDSYLILADSTPVLTPPSGRSDPNHKVDVDMEDTPMPPSRPRFSPASSNRQLSGMTYPLQMAKDRRKAQHARSSVEQTPRASNQDGWLTRMRDEPHDSPAAIRVDSPDTHSWLLSD